MPLLLKTHTKKPWYVTWACDMEVTNSNYHYPARSCRGWAGRASTGACCPGAARPALRCPAAGEGLRGRQRRSAVKLTPLIMFRDLPCRTVGNGRSCGRTEGIFVDGRSVPTTLYRGLFFYWPESGDPFKKSRKMKFHEIRFRLHFCDRHRKTIHMAFGISKNGSDFAVWRRVQVAKKREFSKRGSSGDANSAAPGDANSAAPLAHLAQIQA